MAIDTTVSGSHLSLRRLPRFTKPAAYFLLYSALFNLGVFGVADTILNFYFVSLGHDPARIGFLNSMPRLGGLLISLPIGWLANYIGARRVIIYSSLGVAGTYLVLLVWPALGVLAFSRFLQGAFYGAQQIPSAPLMVTLTTEDRHTRLFAYHNLMSMGGVALGSLLGGWLPTAVASIVPSVVAEGDLPAAQTSAAYAGVLGIAALIILLSVLPLYRLQGDDPTIMSPLLETNPVKLRHHLHLIYLSLPLLLFGISGGLTFPFYNLYFRTTFGISDQLVGIILGLGWLAMALVPLTNQRLERYFGRTFALGLTLTLATFAFLGMSVIPLLSLNVLCFIAAIALRNTMQPLYQPLLMNNLKPADHHVVSSIGFVFWNLGWFGATLVGGRWQTTYGFDFMMQVVAVLVFVNALSILVIFPQRPRFRFKI